MKSFKDTFLFSAREFKNLRCIIVTALLIALNLALDRVSLYITPEIKIGFGFLTSAMIGMLFGPVVAMAAGAMGDILGFFLYPRGAYFFGFTLSAALGGLVYGLFFYRREVKLLPAFLAKLTINLFINVCLNTLWNSMLGGRGFFVLLPARALKNLILWPIESLLLFAAAKGVGRAAKWAKLKP
ncbi:MAG: folate family ECF transporter S component [Eubacteriales bacterium]|nr:folate family ECF transporter S component [Eubacteriales bacterium]